MPTSLFGSLIGQEHTQYPIVKRGVPHPEMLREKKKVLAHARGPHLLQWSSAMVTKKEESTFMSQYTSYFVHPNLTAAKKILEAARAPHVVRNAPFLWHRRTDHQRSWSPGIEHPVTSGGVSGMILQYNLRSTSPLVVLQRHSRGITHRDPASTESSLPSSVDTPRLQASSKTKG